jgi:hypothetical protein
MKLYRKGIGVVDIHGRQGIIVDDDPKEHTLTMQVVASYTQNEKNEELKGKEVTINRNEVYLLGGKPRSRATYYQPRLENDEWGVLLHSFEVYRDYKNAKSDFPDRVIDIYTGNDIENPTYVDDDGGYNNTLYEVSVPAKYNTDSKIFFSSYDKEEAVLFAQLYLGADEHGNLNCISKIS